MIKSILNACKTPTPRCYPYIGKSIRSGAVVLFSIPRWGTILQQGDSSTGAKCSSVGSYVECLEDSFFPIEGSITLSNEP